MCDAHAKNCTLWDVYKNIFSTSLNLSIELYGLKDFNKFVYLMDLKTRLNLVKCLNNIKRN